MTPRCVAARGFFLHRTALAIMKENEATRKLTTSTVVSSSNMPIALEFFVHYAYGILFLWVLVEQLGIPVPTVPLLVTAGTLTATHRLHTLPVMLSILSACAVADSMWFFAGVRYGGRVVRLVCRLSLEASTCVRKTESYFGKHGAVTLLFAKFVPGLSAVAPPIAGQTGMSYTRFLAYDVAGSLIWSSAYVFGGRFFGDLAKRSLPFFHFLGRFGVLLFAVALIAFIARRSGCNATLSRSCATPESLLLSCNPCFRWLKEAAASRRSSWICVTRWITCQTLACCRVRFVSAPQT